MKPKAIELFAGAGGISEGLKQAGFQIKYANEINERAAETYAMNHGETRVDIRDIRETSILFEPANRVLQELTQL